MKKHLLRNLFIFLLLSLFSGVNAANIGDTINIGGRKFRALSTNLITNPGFENGFTGWTDATTSAALLTSAKFNIATTGGVNNSKYLIGLANENSSSAGSIGTGWPIASGKTYLLAYQVKYLDAATAAASEVILKFRAQTTKQHLLKQVC